MHRSFAEQAALLCSSQERLIHRGSIAADAGLYGLHPPQAVLSCGPSSGCYMTAVVTVEFTRSCNSLGAVVRLGCTALIVNPKGLAAIHLGTVTSGFACAGAHHRPGCFHALIVG